MGRGDFLKSWMILALMGGAGPGCGVARAERVDEILPRYFRDLDAIHQRHNDAAEALVRQIREAQARGQPVELMRKRLSEIEDERARDVAEAERRLAQAKARATSEKPSFASPPGGRGAAPGGRATSAPPMGAQAGPGAGAPAAARGTMPAAPAFTREEIVVEGAGGATEIEFRRGEGAAPIQPGAAGEGVTEIQF
jgi:hypothetical protein